MDPFNPHVKISGGGNVVVFPKQQPSHVVVVAADVVVVAVLVNGILFYFCFCVELFCYVSALHDVP